MWLSFFSESLIIRRIRMDENCLHVFRTFSFKQIPAKTEICPQEKRIRKRFTFLITF